MKMRTDWRCVVAGAVGGFLALLGSGVASAALVPYSPNANTVYLYHLNEPAGASVAANAGSAGFSAVSYDGDPYAGDGNNQPTVSTVLGAAGYPGFGNAANLAVLNGQQPATAGKVGLGVDRNGDGAFQLDDNAPISTNDRASSHAEIFGGGDAFTVDAMVNVSSITSGNRQIVSTDNSAGNADRGFQFRINATGQLEFNFIGVATTAVTQAIPTTGPHAFVPNEWFHVAMAYNGTQAQFYWTRVDPSFTAANAIGGLLAEAVDVNDDMPIVIGNEARVVGTAGSAEGLNGLIDEVRITNALCGPNDFIFQVPEPGGLLLMLTGALGAAGFGRRR